MKSMYSRILQLIALSALSFGGSLAHAQSTLKTLEGYQPTLLPTEGEALSIYQQLPTTPFKGSSGCFQRAHNWAYQLSSQKNIKSMKVFLFFTERYKREFDYEWMYHVAPLIPVQKTDGSVEEMVFDPTFINTPSWADSSDTTKYDNKPISINEWIKYFIFPNVECPVVENYQDYFDFQERYYCYIMKTPMYTYIPANLEEEKEVRTNWWPGDLQQMKKAYKAGSH